MAQPEKISLWDRWFNRYRKTVHARGSDVWHKTYGESQINIIKGIANQPVPNTEWTREWVEYLVTDRVTGSERIEKVYLDQ